MGFMERHQVALYLASMAVGVACAGLSGWSLVSEQFVPYALGALLWTNFALMPLTGMSTGQYKKLTHCRFRDSTSGCPAGLLLHPRGWPRCSSCGDCFAGSMRGLRCGFYVYCWRGISRFAGGNALPAWCPNHFYSSID